MKKAGYMKGRDSWLVILMILGACSNVSFADVFKSKNTFQTAEQFQSCLGALKKSAREQGISRTVIQEELATAQYNQKVIDLDRKQPEFSETFYNYLHARVSKQRIKTGRKLLKEHWVLLQALQKEYGVPPQYLLAFWGLETNFGSYLGDMKVLDSLATLACDERRSAFFTSELIAALHLLDSGVIVGPKMVGSWAGAMGNVQFMPSAYQKYGVDADGDGRADLWSSVPDALTSAANFLHKLGWEKGFRWGREVLLPAEFDYSMTGKDVTKKLSEWSAEGVGMVNDQPLPIESISASIIVPSGHQGPAFLVYSNFNVIMGWNRSEFYALSVGLLADQINREAGLKRMPPNVQRLTIADVKLIQIALGERGFDVGEVDGILGSQTRRAVRSFQKKHNMIADGYPDDVVIQALTSSQPIVQ